MRGNFIWKKGEELGLQGFRMGWWGFHEGVDRPSLMVWELARKAFQDSGRGR